MFESDPLILIMKVYITATHTHSPAKETNHIYLPYASLLLTLMFKSNLDCDQRIRLNSGLCMGCADAAFL